jgi:hypothetical protein
MAAASPPVPPSKPEAIRHLVQARSDYGLYQELKPRGEYLDRTVTALFYTALHLAEAGLAEHFQRGGLKSHAQRDSAIYRHLRPIYAEYDPLHTRSNWARYHPTSRSRRLNCSSGMKRSGSRALPTTSLNSASSLLRSDLALSKGNR